MTQSMLAQANPLAIVENQLNILRPNGDFQSFEHALAVRNQGRLTASHPAVLQINVGRMCNQTCKHCHVDAGPDRTEIMTRETMELCLAAIRGGSFNVVDVTGGAPEMNPNFQWLVEQVRALDCHVIDRCNLTILLAPRYEDLIDFLARHAVEIIASLPYYTVGNTDRQRGDGVFEKSIEALKRLNCTGYGVPNSGLTLNLVYNPAGAFLPADQRELQDDFKRQLLQRYGIVFNELYVITNQPINRFLDYLLRTGNYEQYMQRLIDAYNPSAVEGLMCRNMISVSWDGYLYDCDFNQMLDLKMHATGGAHIRDFDPAAMAGRAIVTGLHCYACTAGQGSSCAGAVT